MLKRAVDLVLGTVLAVAVTPLVLVLALAVAVQFRAWPFFVQRRLGRGGRPFRIVKLRTLSPRTPAYTDKYALSTLPVPPLGRLLRRLHLDELPQLWLVPTGRMSLVGPRPEMDFLHQRLPESVAARRLSVRPGCTGLWQVSVHADGLIHEHPEYDLAYVARAGLALDGWIIWHTTRMLLGGTRRVTLDALPGVPAPTTSRAPARTRERASAA